MLPRLLRFAAGLALSVIVWWYAAAGYNRLLSLATRPLLAIDRRFAQMTLQARSREIAVTPTSGGLTPPATIPASQLTYNLILLVALFASNPSPLRDRNVRAFLFSVLIVAALHPIALLISIESTYAWRQGAWSEAHYGDVAARLWLWLEIFWRLVGMFGVVFACWWMGANGRAWEISAAPLQRQEKRRRDRRSP